jgi:2-phosphosulfolactate phosphatase
MNIETCFSPALFDFYKNQNSIVVVVDVLRATTSICTAFANGVRSIIPVETSNDAREMKEKGYIVAGERNGIILDFADFGNSPFNFSPEHVADKDIVYTTTNGTKTIHKAAECSCDVLIGTFTNTSALARWIGKQNKDIIILCAGWKNKYNIEDSLFAGCLAKKLMDEYDFTTICD